MDEKINFKIVEINSSEYQFLTLEKNKKDDGYKVIYAKNIIANKQLLEKYIIILNKLIQE